MKSPNKAASLCSSILVLLIGGIGAPGLQQLRPVTISQARELLSKTPRNGTLGALSLEGLTYSRELELGEGLRVVALSKNRGGGLALFSSAGVLEDSLPSDEITSIELFDLDGDGISEMLTEEIEGRGTGVLIENYKLYSFDGGSIKKLWQRPSYIRDTPWTSDRAGQKIKETRYFVRFDGPSAGLPARMTYLEPTKGPGHYTETIYVMTGSAIRKIQED